MNKLRPMGQKISLVYYLGAAALLLFYSSIFSAIILFTENLNNERRLELVAPFHFQQYEQGHEGIITISPIVKLYDDLSQMPAVLERRIAHDFTGVASFQFENNEDVYEYAVYADIVTTPRGEIKVYAVEVTDAIEWGDIEFFFVESVIFILGFAVLFVVALFIVRAASKISDPFIQLAHKLEASEGDDFQRIELDKVTSIELEQTLSALNNYRTRIRDLLGREKSFTRYISHELRTPMTVVKGALSILRKQNNEQALKQANRIHQAVEQMEQLTQTFLLLARNQDNPDIAVDVDQSFVQKLTEVLEDKAKANQTKLMFLLDEDFALSAEPLLLFSAVHNIVLNAINSTHNGEVEVNINHKRVVVFDDGVGLNEKARGYEGFGVGLLLVRDICQKYNWHFQLTDSPTGKGCCARITFEQAQD